MSDFSLSKEDMFAESAMPPEDISLMHSVISETVKGFEQLSNKLNCVSMFGSSRALEGSKDYIATEKIAKLLVEAGFGIITGGGPGLMEAGNKGASQAGGESIGLHIFLPHEQSSNQYIKTLLTFHHFFTRKLMFVKYAKAYVVMPGGMGTIDELSDAFVLAQTESTKSVPIILYDSTFWNGLLDWIKSTMVKRGYIGIEDVDLITVKDTPEEVVSYIKEQALLSKTDHG